MVSGSSLYEVTIGIKPLTREKWEHIKKTCMGKISSLLEFLSGKLSQGVMGVVSDPKQGLFPLDHEFTLECSCPDWADMCKHSAAVLYGVGSRLDADPAQLFQLRGVNFEELIDIEQAITSVISTSSRRKRMNDAAFSELLGIEETSIDSVIPKSFSVLPPSFPKTLTGDSILEKRKSLGYSRTIFSEHIGVSQATIALWEAKREHPIKPNARSLEKLKILWNSHQN